jgi:hypothetical protein
MTRGEAIKDFFCKTILPVAAAALLYCIFRSACVKTGELDYLWLWILCGLPFGIWRLRLWIIPGGGWDCLVRAELYSGRDHRRFRSGLAADRGGVVCAADGVEIDSWMTTLKTQTGGIIPSGFLIIPCPQKNHMHFLC